MPQVSTVSDPTAWSHAGRVALVVGAAAVLVVSATSIDAVCDDAYISLRHARNLAEHGAPVYNLGERVEGYTSPAWMFLSSLLLASGLEGRVALSALGALGGVALIAAVWRLWNVTAPGKPTPGLIALALVAASTPIAAWTSSGLETPLFTALVALSVAEVASCIGNPTPRAAFVAGAVVALATLTRPEGALIGLTAFVWLVSRQTTRRAALRFALTAAAPVAGFLLWRLTYYGALLPNIVAAKLSAGIGDRVSFGLGYSWFAVKEMGLASSFLIIAGLFVPSRVPAIRFSRAVIILYVMYVVYVGGDFLDLFRFFVPVLPLLFVAFVAAALHVGSRMGATKRGWFIVVCLAAPAYLLGQRLLRQRASQMDEPARNALWIEPLGWTRHYGIAWADEGRFLRAHALPGDTMASPAAGAAPYYAGLPNVDLFGVADAEVAQHGLSNGSRPGHQRFARLEYMLSRRPTYILFDECVSPWKGWAWADAGYVCVEATAPSSFGGNTRLTFLVDSVRAEQLAQEGIVRTLRTD